MAQFEQHFVQDLTQQIKVRHCGSIVFNADNESNVVSVSLFNGSEPVAISGSVVGAVVCSDGSTVPLTGSYSGNTASITLTGDCFAVLGQIGVGIQIVNGTQKTTVLKVIYNVETITTENVVDPGSRITLEVGDLISDIETATAAIPSSDMASLMSGIAPTFSDSVTYKAGAYVYYGGDLYCFTADHNGGTWTGSDATAAVLCDDVSDLKSAVESSMLVQIYNQNSTVQSMYISSITDGVVSVTNSANYKTLWKMPLNGANCIQFSGMCGIPNNTVPIFCFLDSDELAIMDDVIYATGKNTYNDYLVTVPENAVTFSISFRIADVSTFNVDLLRTDNHNPASIWAYSGESFEDKVQTFLNTAPEGTKLDLRGEKVTITKRFTKSQNTRLTYCIISNGTFEIRPSVGGWLEIGADYGYRSPMFENCVFTGGGAIFYDSSYNFKAVGCIFDNCQIINGTYIQACELLGCNVMNESKYLIECQYSIAVKMTNCCFEAGNIGVFKGTGDITGTRASMESGEFTNCIFEGFTNSMFATDGIVADFTNCYVEEVPYFIYDTKTNKDICYVRINGGTINNINSSNTYAINTVATNPSIIATNLNFKGSPTRYLTNTSNRRRQITSSNQNEEYLYGANGGKNEIIKPNHTFSINQNGTCVFATNRTSMTSQPQAFLVVMSVWGFNPNTVQTKISLLTLNYTAGTGYTVTETDIVANQAITTTITWTASADSYDGLVTLTGTASGRCALSVVNLGATMSGMIV